MQYVNIYVKLYAFIATPSHSNSSCYSNKETRILQELMMWLLISEQQKSVKAGPCTRGHTAMRADMGEKQWSQLSQAEQVS